jgi:hypothetical protein
LIFDCVINAIDGCVIGVSMKPMMSNNINGFANASIRNERIYDINNLQVVWTLWSRNTQQKDQNVWV